ncbi:hypothetical protein [Paraburkholderia youngii]|uniref:hypothetical protein n=1 Tax=Paraburkholderia youngii TaxID=2782701 RepID=UPI003D1DAC65
MQRKVIEVRDLKMAKTASAVILAAASVFSTAPAGAQTPGEACSPPGSSVQYYGNGMLMCSRGGKWVAIMKASPLSQFGDNAAVLSTIQDRVSGAFRVVIEAVQQEITDLLN